MSASYTEQQGANTTTSSFLKFLSRHLLLILVLLWTPLILFQTWNVQHSCVPLVHWGSDRCPIERVTVSPRDPIIKVGKSRSLKVDVQVKGYIKDKSSVDRGVQWVSNDEKTATVNAQGQVFAVAPGLGEIKATANKDNKKSDSVTIQVEGITSVEVEPKSLKIEVGQSRALMSNIKGSGNFSTDVNWSSANPEVATIDKNGLVKAIAPGETSLQVMTKQDSSKNATAKLIVSHSVIIERVIIEPIKDLKVGEVEVIIARVEGLGGNSDDIS